MRLGSRAPRLFAVVTLFACAAQSGASNDESLQPLPGCPGRVGTLDGTVWQEVQADGFSFCVPADWRSSRQYSLEGDAGTISWGPGGAERRPFAVATTPGQGAGGNWEATEKIGGSSAKLRRSLVGSSYVTGATWASPRVALYGDAPSIAAATRHVEIYRTVRFTSPSR